MDCLTCGTELTPSNATSFRHAHDVGKCAQVLLAQRDRARALLVEVSNVWGGFKTDFERFIQWVRWNLEGRPVYRYNEKFDMKFMLDRIKP